MAELSVVLTKQGLAKIAEATAEKPLKLEKFAVGDGGGKVITLNQDMTALVNEKYRDYLNSKYAEDNNIVVECVLRANAPITEGFTIRELGIFDDSGTLIAVAKTPESYRPGNKEGVATETIYSVVLKIENTNNIAISLKEGLFATQDGLNREIKDRTAADTELDTKVATNKSTIEALQTQVKDLITTLNKYHDRRIGVIFHYSGENPPEGALKCDGSLVEIAKYQKLFNVIGHKYNNNNDPGQGKFKLPDGQNRYLRGAGNGKTVGTYEEDAIKKHGHGLDLQLETDTFNLVIPPHFHNIADIAGSFWGCGENFNVKDDRDGTPSSSGNGAFWTTPSSRYGFGGGDWDNVEYHFSSHRAGVTRTDDGGGATIPITIKIKHFTGRTLEEGAEETRVKGVMALTCVWFE